jgi:UTP--glucose-1-phosphate uridylyltransferase
VIDGETPCLRQLKDAYEKVDGAVIAVMEVPSDRISAYGVAAVEPVEFNGTNDRLFRVTDLVEKPAAGEAPSNLAIIGRYVLPPEIFGCLDRIEPGSGGELQLTDGLRLLMEEGPVYAYRFEGRRYDAGDKLGFLKATVEFALGRDDLGGAFREYLKGLDL